LFKNGSSWLVQNSLFVIEEVSDLKYCISKKNSGENMLYFLYIREIAENNSSHWRKQYTSFHDIPEFVFTELVLQIFYWIYDIAIHSRIFILDLSSNIDLWNLYYFFGKLGKLGKLGYSFQFICLFRIKWECLKNIDWWWTMTIKKKKKEIN
jgi:hypothetical protein